MMLITALGATSLAAVAAWQIWFTPAPVPSQLEYLPGEARVERVQATKVAVPVADAQGATTFDFNSEKAGATPQTFAPVVGNWVVGKDGSSTVLVVDGRKWSRGQTATGIAERAKSLYGERYAEFLDNVQAFAYFPYAVGQGIDDFREGEITVRFKGVAGRIDQGAGILFNLKPNGDYLTVRANPLEDNLVLWQFVRGRRSSVKWIRNTPTPTNTWHELKVVIRGTTVEGYLNGKLLLTHALKQPVSGRVGLWSKADSVVYFDDYTVRPK